MGKKKKRNLNSTKSSDSIVPEHSNTLLEDIIELLLLIKESKGLVIGSNAVFRGIEKKTIDVVLLLSKNEFPALYHAMSSYCRNSNVLFFQLHDIDKISLKGKVPASAAYGIKVNILKNEEKFSKLIERIDKVRNSLRCQQENKDKKCQITDESPINQDDKKQQESRTEENIMSVKSFLPSKHMVSKPSSFKTDLGLDSGFPDYSVLHEKITMTIKQPS